MNFKGLHFSKGLHGQAARLEHSSILYLLPCFIGAGILALIGTWFPLRSYESMLISLLFLVVGGLALFLLLHRPPLGPLLFVPACLLVPFGVGIGGTSLNIAIVAAPVLVGISAIRIVLKSSRYRIVWSRTMLPLILLCVCGLLSFAVGQFRWFPSTPAPITAQLAGLGLLLSSAGLCLLMPQVITEIRWLKKLTWLFLGLGALHVVLRVFSNWISLPGLFVEGAVGSLFWIWLVCLSFSQSLFNRELHRVTRVGLALLVIAALYVTLVQTGSWASGWLPTLAGIGAIVLVNSLRTGFFLTWLSSLLVLFQSGKLWDLLMVNEQYSWVTRLDAWRIVIEMAMVSPFLGLGPSNYRFYTHLQPILGWNVAFNSHNNYIDIFAQMGLLGLVCFVWVVWELGRLGWGMRRRFPAGFERAYVFGALGGLAGTLVAGMLGDWILPFVYNIGLEGFRASAIGWLFLGGLIALDRMTEASC